MSVADFASSIFVTVTPLENNRQSLEDDWIALEKKSNCSVFLCWAWIGTWINLVTDRLDIHVLKVELDGEIVGLCLLVAERVKRRKIIASSTMVLNSIKHSPYNMIIEHNGFLVKSGHDGKVERAALSYLFNNFSKVDEFVIPFSDSDNIVKSFCGSSGFSCNSIDCTESPLVDLKLIRSGKASYIDTLSSNTRYQIRKSIKLYESMGDLGIEEAGNIDAALFFFEKLKTLHQRSWQQRGYKGSFANKKWESFHRTIIQQQFAAQGVQLLRVFAGDRDVGIIYNLLNNGCVSMIQTGFDYEYVKNAKPGYVCHYMAVEHNLMNGMNVYDFLAGEAQYKNSLSNSMSFQEDLVLQRKKLKFHIEDFFVQLYRKFK